MSLIGKAAVTIWHDVPLVALADYFEWHSREHMAERVAIPGFLRGRRYVALHGAPAYFTLYEAETLETLTGPDYTGRLNNPTPWTRRVAPQLTGNVRSLCRIERSFGTGQGGLIMTMRYDVEPGRESAQRALLEAKLETLAGQPGIVGVHWCLGDTAASAIETNEKKGRPTRALAPNWVVMVEGATDTASLGDTCEQALPRQALIDGGAIDPLMGLYQFQFQPDAAH